MSTPALEIRHLRAIAAVHETGSVTRAAKRLNLTQPAVSHALAQAERRLGAELFRRLPRGLEATAAGDRLARTARSLLDQLHAAEAELLPGDDGEGETLRITTECYTCYHWLPTLLAELAGTLPALQIALVSDSTRRPVEALLAQEVDLAIVHSPVSHREIETVPLFADEVVAVVAPGHRLAGRRTLVAADLEEEHVLLHFCPESSVLFTEVLGPAGVTPRRTSEMQLTEGILALVKAGFGVAAMARWTVAPQLAAGELCALSLTEEGVFRRWSAARRSADAGRRASEELLRILRSQRAGPGAGLVPS